MKKLILLIILLFPFYVKAEFEKYEAVIINENNTTLDADYNPVILDKGKILTIIDTINYDGVDRLIGLSQDQVTYYVLETDTEVFDPTELDTTKEVSIDLAGKKDEENTPQVVATNRSMTPFEIVVFILSGALSLSLIVIVIKNAVTKKNNSNQEV